MFSGSGTLPGTDKPYVHFTEDGHWSASDGCNNTVGTFEVEDNGALFRARSTGFTTLIDCLNVPNAEVLQESRSVDITARRLTFRDGSGSVTGVYARIGSG
jgi:heat shock protein HslJ